MKSSLVQFLSSVSKFIKYEHTYFKNFRWLSKKGYW